MTIRSCISLNDLGVNQQGKISEMFVRSCISLNDLGVNPVFRYKSKLKRSCISLNDLGVNRPCTSINDLGVNAILYDECWDKQQVLKGQYKFDDNIDSCSIYHYGKNRQKSFNVLCHNLATAYMLNPGADKEVREEISEPYHIYKREKKDFRKIAGIK